MPPKIDKTQPIQPIIPPVVKKTPPSPKVQPKIEQCSVNTKHWESTIFGTQQKDRLERLMGAGTGGFSAANDVRLARATANANKAYFDTYAREWNALKNSTQNADFNRPVVNIPNAPKNMFEVSQRAETAYRNELSRQGFDPSVVRGDSAIKAADFLRSNAATNGDFTTLSPNQIQNRIANNTETKYFARILDTKYLGDGNSRLSQPASPHTWVATPEEIAGAKLDTYETMKRVGYSDDYINQIKADVASGKKNLSDYKLVLTEASSNSGKTVPSWDNLISTAKNEPAFKSFSGKPDSFWQDVQNLDYKQELPKLDASKNPGFDSLTPEGKKQAFAETRTNYLKSLTPAQQDVFLAREQMSRSLGVNEYFTNDGRTARTDGRNGTYGVREFLVDNTQMQSMQQHTFVDLTDSGKTGLQTVDKPATIASNPLNLRTEMRNGGLIAGGFSAVTSLPQVFDQASQGDYLGAAKTLGTNTALGTTVGALSAGGERIIGNGLENVLGRSTFANNLIDRGFSNAATRKMVSSVAQTETTNLTSSAFNSTVRSVAGRVGGAGVVGGVVNGAFSAYDQIGAYKRGEVTGSQAIGTVTGEVAVGVGAGMAGAAAGAAIGSIIPGAGTIVGGVIGFGVGMAAGYLADKGLRGLGVDKAIAQGVTFAIDKGTEAFNATKDFVSNQVNNAVSTVTNVANDVKNTVSNAVDNFTSGAASTLKSIFSW